MWQHQSSPFRKTEPGVKGHVATPELTSVWRRGLGHGTCGGTGAHLCREVWSKDTDYVAARGCMHYSLS
jgi:hypothetical protein